MNPTDFYEWEDAASQYKLKNISPRPYLNAMAKVRFQRGKKTLEYANEFEALYTEIDFLKVRCKRTMTMPKRQENARGIQKQNKDDIIKNLGAMIPDLQLRFWKDIPEENVVDLINANVPEVSNDSYV